MRSTAATVALFGPAQHGQRFRQDSFLNLNMDDTNFLHCTRTVNKGAKDFLFNDVAFSFQRNASLTSLGNLKLNSYDAKQQPNTWQLRIIRLLSKLGGTIQNDEYFPWDAPTVDHQRTQSNERLRLLSRQKGGVVFLPASPLTFPVLFFIIISTPSFPFWEPFASIFSCCRVND